MTGDALDQVLRDLRAEQVPARPTRPPALTPEQARENLRIAVQESEAYDSVLRVRRAGRGLRLKAVS